MRLGQIASVGCMGAVVGALGWSLWGCSSSEPSSARASAQPASTVTASSFAGQGASVAASAAAQPEREPDAPTRVGSDGGEAVVPVMAIGGKPRESSERPAPAARAQAPAVSPTTSPPPAAAGPVLSTTVNKPPAVDAKAGALGVNVLVESLVGQINGRPVFASEILEPLDGRLRQIGASAPNEQVWTREAARAIVRELQSRIEDELVLAEAKRNLTPEQKQGLFVFLQQVQDNLAATQKGSSIAADEALKESTGQGIRQAAQDKLDQELIRKELMDKVASRVVVSWTDIKNEYERSYDQYNPPAVALLRMIIVDPKKPENAGAVAAELSAGKPFADVAASELNTFNRPEGGKFERTFALTQSEGEFLPNPELNQVCRTLAVGQVVGPIQYNPRPPEKDKPAPPVDPANMRTAWLSLERIERPEGVSLYDAQLEIDAKLRSQRQSEEVQRYMEQLRKRGNISRMEVMGQRLLLIATERYAPRFLNAPAAPQKKK